MYNEITEEIWRLRAAAIAEESIADKDEDAFYFEGRIDVCGELLQFIDNLIPASPDCGVCEK